MNGDVLPQVIVTNKYLALMNALEVLFPSTTNMLCKSHISKNVKAKCKMPVTKAEDWETMMDTWASLVSSIDEEMYKQWLKSFTNMCAHYPTFQEYVYYTWLMHHRERYVQAWTDHVLHVVNTTTNRYIFLITCFTFCLLCIFCLALYYNALQS